jgi:hypothetical protein
MPKNGPPDRETLRRLWEHAVWTSFILAAEIVALLLLRGIDLLLPGAWIVEAIRWLLGWTLVATFAQLCVVHLLGLLLVGLSSIVQAAVRCYKTIRSSVGSKTGSRPRRKAKDDH